MGPKVIKKVEVHLLRNCTVKPLEAHGRTGTYDNSVPDARGTVQRMFVQHYAIAAVDSHNTR